MSTYTKAKTARQQEHTDSSSPRHHDDKQRGDERRLKTWIGVDTPQGPSPRRSFGDLEGHAQKLVEGSWHRCLAPGEFADYVVSMAKTRSRFLDHTTRNGVEVTMKRTAKTPIEVLTTTFAPWLSDWTAAEIAAGRDPRRNLAIIRNLWLQDAQTNLAGQRYLLGYAFHADTDDLHFDLVCSRQDGKGGRIGKAGLKLCGPWVAAVDRQVRAGAAISTEKRSQINRSMANFHHRYGADAMPLDVKLARALDTAAETVLGAELTPFRTAYAATVPLMERRHTEAQLATLEAAREKLLQKMPPSPVAPKVPDSVHMSEFNLSSPDM